jgi:vacuolar protein sorting-associated protein 35
VALNFIKSVISRNAVLSEVEQVDQLLSAITPLIRDQDGYVPAVDADGRELPASAAFGNEQKMVAKIIHLMRNDDTDSLLRIYGVAKKHFMQGNYISHGVLSTMYGLIDI